METELLKSQKRLRLSVQQSRWIRACWAFLLVQTLLLVSSTALHFVVQFHEYIFAVVQVVLGIGLVLFGVFCLFHLIRKYMVAYVALSLLLMLFVIGTETYHHISEYVDGQSDEKVGGKVEEKSSLLEQAFFIVNVLLIVVSFFSALCFLKIRKFMIRRQREERVYSYFCHSEFSQSHERAGPALNHDPEEAI